MQFYRDFMLTAPDELTAYCALLHTPDGTPIVGVIPVQFILALPYVLTVLLLAGFVGKAIPPKALGVPFETE